MYKHVGEINGQLLIRLAAAAAVGSSSIAIPAFMNAGACAAYSFGIALNMQARRGSPLRELSRQCVLDPTKSSRGRRRRATCVLCVYIYIYRILILLLYREPARIYAVGLLLHNFAVMLYNDTRVLCAIEIAGSTYCPRGVY